MRRRAYLSVNHSGGAFASPQVRSLALVSWSWSPPMPSGKFGQRPAGQSFHENRVLILLFRPGRIAHCQVNFDQSSLYEQERASSRRAVGKGTTIAHGVFDDHLRKRSHFPGRRAKLLRLTKHLAARRLAGGETWTLWG